MDNFSRRLTYITVKGLFGSLDHVIPLQQEGVTIVHGPNGCGKTTVLKILSSLINWDFKVLKNTRFKQIELGLGGARFVRVTKRTSLRSGQQVALLDEDQANSSMQTDDDQHICLELFEGNQRLQSEELLSDSDDEFYAKILHDSSLIRKLQPTLRQVGPRAWRDSETDVRYTTLEVSQLLHESLVQMPRWFSQETHGIEVGFINAQRLLDVSRQPLTSRVEERPGVRQFVEIYSEDIKLRINEALNNSAIISQRRERSFPERMLNKQYGEAVNNTSILADYAKLQERFAKLAETGLQEEIPLLRLQSNSFNPTERRVLALYLDDLNEKLNVFSELQDQIDVFKAIVGKKFRRKSLNIDRNVGFAIRDDAGVSLLPSVLSSGEQHQIVMFYDLIFSKKSGLLFLIDEPEISLHVEWQRQFLSDLDKITKLKGHQFLIATHSPQVIGARRDIAIALDGGLTEDTPPSYVDVQHG